MLEFTLVRFGFNFNFDYSVVVLLVFWALGLAMIALAGLVHLPFRTERKDVTSRWGSVQQGRD